MALNLEVAKRDIRDLMSRFVTNIKSQTALGLGDLNRHSEGFLLELFREIHSLPSLRNLNRESANFPGLDLGDDATGRAFQITATPTLDKIKETLTKIVKNNLHDRFPLIRIYVITERQSTYSQSAIDEIVGGRFEFDAAHNIVDYRDLMKECATLELERLQRVLQVLRKHLEGPPAAEAPAVLLPPQLVERHEPAELNVVPIWTSPRLYLADYVGLKKEQQTTRRRRGRQVNPRDAVVKEMMESGYDVPEDFEIHDGQLVTFQDLTQPIRALEPYFDRGTVADFAPSDFYSIDEDQLHVFQSLLRRSLQRQLRSERVQWQHKLHFFFYSFMGDEMERTVKWIGEKAAERVVCSKTMKTEKPDEILTCKHLAFGVGFHLISRAWYLSITPTWYFSRDGYHVDGFGADRISWLKRKENDQQVHTHFRFILHRLKELQESSLFDAPRRVAHIQVGDPIEFTNHPYLPDEMWNPPNPKKGDPSSDGQGSLDYEAILDSRT